MMPNGWPTKVEFKAEDKISKLLKCKKLNGKYGPKYNKHLSGYANHSYWKIDRAALELMAKKYGDIKIGEAIEKFSAEKPWRNNGKF